jgi:hypothetical protein
MPKIEWRNLPPELRDHLFTRCAEREITTDDLYRLKEWQESSPDAPERAMVQRLRIIQCVWGRQIPKDFSLAKSDREG